MWSTWIHMLFERSWNKATSLTNKSFFGNFTWINVSSDLLEKMYYCMTSLALIFHWHYTMVFKHYDQHEFIHYFDKTKIKLRLLQAKALRNLGAFPRFSKWGDQLNLFNPRSSTRSFPLRILGTLPRFPNQCNQLDIFLWGSVVPYLNFQTKVMNPLFLYDL